MVSGIDAASLAAVEAFYDRLVERTVAVSGTREAELTKLLENTFRHVNIALVNELAMFAADLDIDVWEAIDAASTKPFGYLRFTPGPGVGGHCLPIDPSYLSWKVRRSLGQPFRFVELANDVNEHMPDYVVRRLMLAFNRMGRSINGSRVLLLGLAYKRNTGDAREAPGTVIARLLVALGADVRVADPHLAAGTLAYPAGGGRPPTSWRPPTPWCWSPTTTPSTTTWSAPTPATSSTPGTAWTARPSNGCRSGVRSWTATRRGRGPAWALSAPSLLTASLLTTGGAP